MGVVHLPDHLRQVIERHVAEGRVESEAAYLEQAICCYAADLEADDEIAAAAEAGIIDADAGRYVTVASPQEAEALHRNAITRLRNHLAGDVE